MRRLRGLSPAAAYIALCAGCVLWFWLGLLPGDEMGYAVLVFYLLLPAGALLCAACAARRGGRVWWTPPLFGLLAMLTEWLTFSLSNTLYTGRRNPPALGLFALGAICALVGIALSALAKRRENRHR